VRHHPVIRLSVVDDANVIALARCANEMPRGPLRMRVVIRGNGRSEVSRSDNDIRSAVCGQIISNQ